MSVSAEEMAEMVFILLSDLGYKPKHDFNKRIFLSPNNEAFLSVFQFLLPLADRNAARERFKFCFSLDDRKKESEFRKVLCSWLQELAAAGELGNDVPPIKMALFTSPGRSTFLHVLLCFIEFILRKRSSSLDIIMPPDCCPIDDIKLAIDYYQNQTIADRKLRDDLRKKMKEQVDLLVEELQKTESAVNASQVELRKAQQQEKTLKEDEENLEQFSKALAQLSRFSEKLQRIVYLAKNDTIPFNAVTFVEMPHEELLAIFPQLQPLTEVLQEQIILNRVDMTTYVQLVNTTLKCILPVYNEISRKLNCGSAIEKIVAEQNSVIEKAHSTLSRVQKAVKDKTEESASRISGRFKHEEDEVILNLEPPSVPELLELESLAKIDFNVEGGPKKVENKPDGGMMPPRAPLRRKRLNLQNTTAFSTMVGDISGISAIEPTFATPRIKSILRESQRKRRSIKEIFTSTPFTAK